MDFSISSFGKLNRGAVRLSPLRYENLIAAPEIVATP
jgi:hypothetical protein